MSSSTYQQVTSQLKNSFERNTVVKTFKDAAFQMSLSINSNF